MIGGCLPLEQWMEADRMEDERGDMGDEERLTRDSSPGGSSVGEGSEGKSSPERTLSADHDEEDQPRPHGRDDDDDDSGGGILSDLISANLWSPPDIRVSSASCEDGRELEVDEVENSGSIMRPRSDPWSLAASRLYRAISNQHKYTSDEAIGILLREVEAHDDADLSESKLVGKLGLEEESVEEERARFLSSGGAPVFELHRDSLRKPSDHHLRDLDEEEEEELREEGEKEGFGAAQLAAIARFLNLGTYTGVYDLTGVFEHYMDKSNMDSLIEYALSKFREQWRTLLHGLFPVQHMQTMLLVCLVQIITVNRLIGTLPVLFCYATFVTMTYSTLRMFHNRHRMKQVELWQRLLRFFGPNSAPATPTTEATPSIYSWSSVEPYVHFFASLSAFVICFGLCGKDLPNCLLLCGISSFFLLLCFLALTRESNGTALLVLFLNLLSHGPVLERKFGHRNLLSSLFSPLFSVDFGGTFSFNMGISSVALLLIPLIYLVLTLAEPRREVHKVAVPHMVCLAWSETAISLFLAGQMSYDIPNILLTAGVISLIFWPTGAGLALVGGLMVAQLRSSLNALSVLKAFLTLCVLMLPFFYRKLKKLIFTKYGIWQDASQKGKRTIVLLVFYAVLVLMSVALFYHGSVGPGVEKDVTNLSWTHFEKECGSTAKTRDNQIRSQILCSELKGTAVNWTGSIQSIRVSKIDNSLESLLDYLPNTFASWLRCFYARRDSERKWGLSPVSCSLSSHHLYTLEVEVVGPWGEQLISTAKGAVVLTASHLFKDMLEYLGEGDVVKFVAFFDQYPVLRYPSRMRLLKLDCVTCRRLTEDKWAALNLVSVSDRSLYRGFWSKLCYALKYAFNFIFAPLFYIPT